MSQDSHIFPRCVKGPRADLFAKPMGQTAECGIRLPIVAPKRLNCKCCSRNRQLDRVGAVGAHTSRPHFQWVKQVRMVVQYIETFGQHRAWWSVSMSSRCH